MITADFSNLRIAGIASAVPTTCVQAHDYDDVFGEETVTKNVEVTGVKQSFHAPENQTVSDLMYVAAQRLINELSIDPASIGVLIFVSPYPDYITPPTSCVLQKRLGLSMDCIALDINLGCSGYVYGLETLCALLQTSNAKRGVLLVGDACNKVLSPLDRTRIMFGDGGSATLVEKSKTRDGFHFALKNTEIQVHIHHHVSFVP